MKMKLFGIVSIIYVIGLCASLAIAQEAQSSPEIETITTLAQMIRWRGVIASLFVIFGAWLLLSFVDGMVAKLGKVFAERRMLFQKVAAFFHFGVYFTKIVLVVILSLKISNEVLAILGGTAAVAMGFALKDLVASVVAGVMIMFDRPFQVGDRVSFGGEYGDITAIGLRSVRLQTLDDNTVTIPNNMFLTQVTSSGNYGALDMQVVVDFHIGIDQNARRAQEIVSESAATSRFVYLSKPVTVRIAQVIIENYVAVRVRVKLYVFDVKYEKALVSDVTLRVLDAFEAEGIHPPAILHRNVTNSSVEMIG